MYAQLGNIVFEGLIGFDSFDQSSGIRHNEHELIGVKPRTGVDGLNLDSISISIRLHAEFCTPEDEIKALKEAMNTFTVMPLVLGNGRVIGSFLITDLDESIMSALPDGTIMLCKVDIKLQEYVVQDKQVQNERESKANAVGLADNNPKVVRGDLKSQMTDAGKITTSTVFIGSDAANVEARLKEAQSNPSRFDYCVGKINESLREMNKYVNMVNDAMTGNLSPYIPEMPAAVASLTSSIGAMLDAAGASSLPGMKAANEFLQTGVFNLKKSASIITSLSITRKL